MVDEGEEGDEAEVAGTPSICLDEDTEVGDDNANEENLMVEVEDARPSLQWWYAADCSANKDIKSVDAHPEAFSNEKKPNNFLKMVQWSPDGSALLSLADDAVLRCHDLHLVATEEGIDSDETQGLRDVGNRESDVNSEYLGTTLKTGLEVVAGDAVYDMSWWPSMTAADHSTCVFAATSRSHPICLYDAIKGRICTSYSCINDLDELAPAYSIAIRYDSARIAAGRKGVVHIFDSQRPGRDHLQRLDALNVRDGDTHVKGHKRALIRSIAYAPMQGDCNGLLAAGTYSNTIAIFSPDQPVSSGIVTLLEEHQGGITLVKWSTCGNYIFTGARKDSSICCWDMRRYALVYKLHRDSRTTNQRIFFDIEPCGQHLLSGGEDGKISVYDISIGELRRAYGPLSSDVLAAVDINPRLPLIAAGSGQRRFRRWDVEDNSSSESPDDFQDSGEAPFNRNCLALWEIPCQWNYFAGSG